MNSRALLSKNHRKPFRASLSSNLYYLGRMNTRALLSKYHSKLIRVSFFSNLQAWFTLVRFQMRLESLFFNGVHSHQFDLTRRDFGKVSCTNLVLIPVRIWPHKIYKLDQSWIKVALHNCNESRIKIILQQCDPIYGQDEYQAIIVKVP